MRSLVSAVAVVIGFAMLAEAAPKSITVQGHRGARTVRPENTLPAFEFAIEAGADVLELDLGVTSDNVLVVHHDQSINLKICQGPEGETAIRRLTLEQVKQFDCGSKRAEGFPRQELAPGARIPTLDEVLALAPKGSFWFNIEIKSNPKRPELAPEPEEFARLVAGAVRKHKLENRVVVQSFDWRNLKALKAIAPELRLAALYGGLPKDFVKIAAEAGGVPIVSPHHLLITKGRVKKAQKAGLEVVPWTANDAKQWDRLIKANVDSIITDDPAALIEHLRARKLR
jgi:glycerophosphoryl diester phosphodiesterase